MTFKTALRFQRSLQTLALTAVQSAQAVVEVLTSQEARDLLHEKAILVIAKPVTEAMGKIVRANVEYAIDVGIAVVTRPAKIFLAPLECSAKMTVEALAALEDPRLAELGERIMAYGELLREEAEALDAAKLEDELKRPPKTVPLNRRRASEDAPVQANVVFESRDWD